MNDSNKYLGWLGIDSAEGPRTNDSTKYFGKYRGTVTENVDPEGRGRIQAMVPDVSNGTPSSWALPCVPLAGKSMGFYVVPQIGAGVWIEYEQGDPDYPIWTGGFWGVQSEVPALAKSGNQLSPSIILQSGLQNIITISDVAGSTGGIMLKSVGGATITVNDEGVSISNGKGAKIVLSGSKVTINDDGLVVS